MNELGKALIKANATNATLSAIEQPVRYTVKSQGNNLVRNIALLAGIAASADLLLNDGKVINSLIDIFKRQDSKNNLVKSKYEELLQKIKQPGEV